MFNQDQQNKFFSYIDFSNDWDEWWIQEDGRKGTLGEFQN